MFGVLFLLLVVGLFVLAAVRALHPAWWRRAFIRRGLVAILLITAVGALARNAGLGRVFDDFRSPSLTIAGGVVGGAGIVVILSLFLTVPLAGLVRVLANRFSSPSHSPSSFPVPSSPSPVPCSSPPLLSLRTLVETAAASLPLAGLGLGAAGVAGAFVPTAIVPRPLAFSGLPDDLAGLKILQLTDVHLGAFMDPAGVVDLVERARREAPDLVVLTGDFCDHLPWLPAALRAIQTLDPRLGIYAVMGNHEHYRGALATRRAYAQTRIELLDDAHRVLPVGSAKLVVAGVDDPARSRARSEHYARAIDKALSGAPSDSFRLGLCHRPSGFETLATQGIDLTLSGHTHGAQLGNGDKSLLEPFAEGAFLRGVYERDGKRLYTSSGAGHWLAFRLDCPSEAALITLEKA
jgi:predicted MPP superfamily phosphohydrolase